MAINQTKTAKTIKGHISQVIGPVIDVSFESDGVSNEEIQLPSIHDSIEVVRDNGRVLVAEIQQHIGREHIGSDAQRTAQPCFFLHREQTFQRTVFQRVVGQHSKHGCQNRNHSRTSLPQCF